MTKKQTISYNNVNKISLFQRLCKPPKKRYLKIKQGFYQNKNKVFLEQRLYQNQGLARFGTSFVPKTSSNKIWNNFCSKNKRNKVCSKITIFSHFIAFFAKESFRTAMPRGKKFVWCQKVMLLVIN